MRRNCGTRNKMKPVQAVNESLEKQLKHETRVIDQFILKW